MGTLKLGERWKTVSACASRAMMGETWMPDEPVPMTPTRLPSKDAPSSGQRAVKSSSPAKVSTPGIFGLIGAESAAGGENHEAGTELLTRGGGQCPDRGGIVEVGRGDGLLEAVAPLQIEAVGHVIDIGQDLRLRGETLGPGPTLLQLLIERVGVVDALHIAACARIAVPEPGAADIRTGLQAQHIQSGAGRPMDTVEPGESRADDDHIVLTGLLRAGMHACPLAFV